MGEATGEKGLLAVIAGSGMGGVSDAFETIETIPFEEIGLTGGAGVAGHAGEVRLCRSDGVDFFLVLGRHHVYEARPRAADVLVAFLVDRGAGFLVSVSAAGSLNARYSVGDLVAGHSMLDLQNRRTSDGGSPARMGRDRFDRRFVRRIEGQARRCGIPLRRGVFACVSGPNYETAAEVSMLRRGGADIAMMSGAAELDAAARRGIPAAAIALVTNPATGVARAVPRHGEVLDVARVATPGLARLISQLIDL